MQTFTDIVLAPGAVRTVFQPIVRFGATGWTVQALECLTRGPADTPFASAVELFTAARRCELTSLVDRVCVEAALDTIRLNRIPHDVFLNVEATTLVEDERFPEFIQCAAAAHGIPWSRITIEVTEYERGREVERLAAAVRELHARGARVAFDDFGPGDADDRALMACTPDIVKIDGPLLNAGRRSLTARQLVERVVARARDCGALVVAEGLERPADLFVAAMLGVDLLQGNLLRAPLDADIAADAEDLLHFDSAH